MKLAALPRHATAFALVAVVAAAAFVAVPAWQLIGPGPFDWHVRQAAFVQGGLEALALIALAGVGLMLDRRWSLLALSGLPILFYLRRHAVDVPLLIDVAYLEIVVGLGALVLRRFRLPPPADAVGYLRAFTCGFVVWSVAAWSASALDAGSIRTLRWLTLLLAIPAAFGGHVPLVLHLWRSRRGLDATARFWSGALAAWIAVLCARTNVVFSHDALWYGLRGEYVLAPGSSVYEPLGLVSPVHYFPKLYEMFLLPVSALGDSSVVDGMTLAMLVLVLLACHALACRIGLPSQVRWPVSALVATLPALANSALEPKPDVISVLFVLLAAEAALSFVRSRAASEAAWLFTFGTLACLAKLTAIPYVGALVLMTAFVAWRRRGHETARLDRRRSLLALAVAAGTLVLAAFVTARTWRLAGMPTIGPDPLFGLWSALGLRLQAPVGTLEWTLPQDWADVPALVVDWLFRPQHLQHVVISWVGNVWLWCALLALIAVPLARNTLASDRPNGPLAALMATGFALAVGIRYHVRGSDGNYFLAALLPAVLVASTALFSRLAALPRAFAAALACLPAFVLFQAAYAFASAGWQPGTRAFDIDLARNWRDTRSLRRQRLESAGLTHIGEHLARQPGIAHVVGYAVEAGSFWLPARFEHVVTISFSRPDYVYDAQRFLGFLAEQRIDYLILPLPGSKESIAPPLAPSLLEAASILQADANVRRIDDREYYLLDLSARRRRGSADLR